MFSMTVFKSEGGKKKTRYLKKKKTMLANNAVCFDMRLEKLRYGEASKKKGKKQLSSPKIGPILAPKLLCSETHKTEQLRPRKKQTNCSVKPCPIKCNIELKSMFNVFILAHITHCFLYKNKNRKIKN